MQDDKANALDQDLLLAIADIESMALSEGGIANLKPWAPYGLTTGIELTDLFANNPGSGFGTAVMTRLSELSDAHCLPVYLKPSGSRAREFYERFGYARDHNAVGFMVRYPTLEIDDEGDFVLPANR